MNKAQENDPKHFKDQATGLDLEVINVVQLSEWLCENYQKYGASIEFITDKSQEGYQFVNGFGGIGGFLRYKIEIDQMNINVNVGGDDFDADEDFIWVIGIAPAAGSGMLYNEIAYYWV